MDYQKKILNLNLFINKKKIIQKFLIEHLKIYIFQLAYKSYEKKNEREKKLEKVKNFINFFGDNEKDSSKIVKIFGKKFLNKNKNKCKIAYKNKKYELR